MSNLLLKAFGILALMQFSFHPLESRHPLHVSTTDINHNAKDQSLEITCRIFTDDFESILASKFKQKVDLLHPKSKKEMDELVAKYLNANLSFRVNQRLVQGNYIGYEIDREAVNVYLEITGINSLNTLSITNTILYDRFDDQMNIVHVAKSSARKSAKVNFPNRQMLITF
jgi:hypothetical protein